MNLMPVRKVHIATFAENYARRSHFKLMEKLHIQSISIDTAEFPNAEKIILKRVSLTGHKYYELQKNSTILGTINFGKKEGIEFLEETGKLPDYYLKETQRGKKINLKPYIHVSDLEAKQKGVKTGTKLMKLALHDSIRSGAGGRILLDAECMDNLHSPIPFYFKLGFRSVNPDINELAAKCIYTGEEFPLDIGTKMYLPKENIKHLLHY